MTDPFWTTQKEAELREAWKARKTNGESATSIAKRLGVSRNAVLGKINRMGLSAPAGPRPKVEPVRAPLVRRPIAPPLPEIEEPLAIYEPLEREDPGEMVATDLPEAFGTIGTNGTDGAAVGITIEQLRARTCRWPMGDPTKETFRFCGGDCGDNPPYCAEHRARAYVPNAKKSR